MNETKRGLNFAVAFLLLQLLQISYQAVIFFCVIVLRESRKICKWYSPKMSSNKKHSCTNGFSSSSTLKEAKKELLRGKAKGRRLKRGFLLLIVLFLLVWVLTCLFVWKVKGPVRHEDHIDSSDNCNVMAETDEVEKREFHDHTTDHCEDIHIRFAKIVLCILIGVAVSYHLCKLYDQQRSQKHETIQQQPHAQDLSRSTGKWRKKLLVIFVLGGIIFSVLLFWHLNKDIMLRRKETLASMCDERARMLQDQFNVSMNHVHALAILISTFHHGKQPSAIDQKKGC